MDLVRSSDITHIYTSTLRSRKQTASDPRKVSLASHASNSQLLTRQGRERKFRKVKGHFLDAVPFTPSPLAATFPSSKKARPSFQSWNIGRGCDVARFIAFRVKIEYRISMILRAMACIGLEGKKKRKRVSRENVCRPLELDNLRFSRFLFGPKTTLFDNLTPSLHFHSTFLFSPLRSLVSHEFPSRPPSSSQRNKFTRRSCIFLCATNLCILEGIEFLRLGSCWLRPGSPILLRYSRSYARCSTNGAWVYVGERMEPTAMTVPNDANDASGTPRATLLFLCFVVLAFLTRLCLRVIFEAGLFFLNGKPARSFFLNILTIEGNDCWTIITWFSRFSSEVVFDRYIFVMESLYVNIVLFE